MKKMLTTRMSFVVLMAVSPLAAAFTNGSDRLLANDYMTSNQYLASTDGRFRFYLQGDGNLVLRNSAGSAVWSTQTNGSGGVRLLLQNDANTVITLSGSASMSVNKGSSFADPGATASDNVDCNITIRIVKTGSVNTATVGTYTLSYNVSDAAGNAANTVTRTVTVTAPPPTTPPATPPGNGDNDGKAASTGQFSAPSAALYTLNNAKQRVFPRHIDTGFGGNGHAETWDGHVFVRTRTAGWFASAFRPQRIVLNSDGSPNFANAFGNNDIALELNTDAPDMQHNWIAIMPDPAVTGENPYPSNSTGGFSATGTYRTYKAMVYHTSLRNNDNDQMGMRKATIIVSNGNTADAEVVSARFTTPFAKFTQTNGADLRCIEPSATIDGRLIICQGHPTEPGKIDNLVYSWNSSPGATTNWRVNKSIATGTVRLFTMQNGIELFLANGSTLTGVMQDTAGVRRQLNGPAIASGSWVHVAFSYNPFNKNQSLWVNGARVANTTVTGFGTLQTSGAVQVGPVNSTASMILDEVKVSNVARHAHEIAHNAYSRSHRAPSAALLASIPSHLTSLRVTRHLQWIASAALPQALARPCSTM